MLQNGFYKMVKNIAIPPTISNNNEHDASVGGVSDIWHDSLLASDNHHTSVTTEAASRSFHREPGLHIQHVIPHNPKKICMTFYHILMITFFLPEQPDSFSPSHFLVFSSFKLKHYRETS